MSKRLKEMRKRTKEIRARIKDEEEKTRAAMSPQERQIYDMKQKEFFRNKGGNPMRDVEDFE